MAKLCAQPFGLATGLHKAVHAAALPLRCFTMNMQAQCAAIL